MSATPSQEYPIEKLFLMREFYTKYTAFVAGDYATFASVDYPVRAVHPWDELGGLDTFYRVIVEYKHAVEPGYGWLDFSNPINSAYEVVV